MNSTEDHPLGGAIQMKLRGVILELADREEEIAFTEAAAVPYWAPPPASISGHRSAATCLRHVADRFLEAS